MDLVISYYNHILRYPGSQFPDQQTCNTCRASVAAQELTSEYLAYYNMVSNALEFGSSEDVYWLQSNMTKTIDETAGELQVFNNYVIAWRTTGLMPKRIISQEIKVRQLLGEIEKLWTQY